MPEQSLVGFVTEVNGESHLRIEHDFGDGFVRLHTSEAERRQAAQDIQCSEDIVIELLRNARDAHATHVFLALSKEGARRVITVLDDGDGIPSSMWERVFEPRVTSKLDTSHMDAWGLHGRGMALYSISENTKEARVIASDVGLGSSIRVVSDTTSLREKRDQSTFPLFILDENGTVNVRGPKNISRTACEFAIETRNDCAVYLGSQAEIAAALYAHGQATLSAVDRAFCKNRNTLPLVKRLATASDPQDFSLVSSQIGLDLSERTARRIMDGSIFEPAPLLDQIVIQRESNERRTGKRAKKRHAVLSKNDVTGLSEAVCKAFKDLADQYYLEDNIDPVIRVGADKVTITIPLVEKS